MEYRSADFGGKDNWHFRPDCPQWPTDANYPYRWIQVWPPNNICLTCQELELTKGALQHTEGKG